MIRLRSTQPSPKGQTLLEFGLVLPILLLLIIGIAEFAWFAALESASVSASREAARYGSSVGDNGSGTPRYVDCAGMRAAARNAAGVIVSLTDAQIRITYDDGAGGPSANACPPLGTGPTDSQIDRFDRVIVEVHVPYNAMTPLGEPFLSARDLVHRDSRSIGKPS